MPARGNQNLCSINPHTIIHTMFSASRRLFKAPVRFATTLQKPTNSFREKTFKEAWCSDAGAYPVMGTIVFAMAFCACTMVYFTATHPDSRVTKSARKSIFRGELKGVC